MSGKSPIQWTETTWNPIVGCTRVSAGCDHCYAATLHNRRYIAWKRGNFPTAPAQYHQPFKQVQLLPQRLSDPLHWRKPRRVFVNSMSDLFHEDVPDEFILQVFTVMRRASQHTFQILTKRPARMSQFMQQLAWRTPTTAELWDGLRGWQAYLGQPGSRPLTNVWLGVSVENQQAADERIPLLLETPAAVRFLSCEPLLGEVDLHPYLWEQAGPAWAGENLAEPGLDWVIIGGESGLHARTMNAGWAESLAMQCREADVAVFVKQLGTVWAKTCGLKDRHGGDMEEWPADLYALKVREYPESEAL